MQLRIIFGKENLWLSLFDANDCVQQQLGCKPAYFATTDERSVVYFGENWRKKYFENWKYRDYNTKESDCEYFGNLYDCMNEEAKVCFYKNEDHTPEDLTEAIYLYACDEAKKASARINSICFTCLPCWSSALRKRLKEALEKKQSTQEIKFEKLLGQVGLGDYVLGISYEDNSFELGCYVNDGWKSLYCDSEDGDCRKHALVTEMMNVRKRDMSKEERSFEYRACSWEIKEKRLFEIAKQQRLCQWWHKWLFKEGYPDSNVAVTIDDYLQSPKIESDVHQLGNTCKTRISDSNVSSKNKICFVGEIFKEPILEDVLNKAILEGSGCVCTKTVDSLIESMFSVSWADRADGDDELVICQSLKVASLIQGDLVFLHGRDAGRDSYATYKYLGQKQFEVVENSRGSFARGEKVRVTAAEWPVGQRIEFAPMSMGDSVMTRTLVEIKAPKRIVGGSSAKPTSTSVSTAQPAMSPVSRPQESSNSGEALSLDSLPMGTLVTISAGSVHCFRKESSDQWAVVSSTGSLKKCVNIRVTFDKPTWRNGEQVSMRLEDGRNYHTGDMTSFEVELPVESSDDLLDLLTLPMKSQVTIHAGSVHCFRKESSDQWAVVSSTGSLKKCVNIRVTFDKPTWRNGEQVSMRLEDGRKYHTGDMTSFEVIPAEENEEGSGFEIM